MPVAGRLVPPRHELASRVRPSRATAAEAMNQAHAASVTGILNQLSHVAAYANEVFEEIAAEAKRTSSRVLALGERVDALLADRLPAADLADNNAVVDEPIRFSRKTLPQTFRELYDACEKPPELDALDVYSKDGECRKKYSHPEYFLEEWLARETAKQEKALEEKTTRRKLKKEHRAKEAAPAPLLHVTTWREKYGTGEGAELRTRPPTVALTTREPSASVASREPPPSAEPELAPELIQEEAPEAEARTPPVHLPAVTASAAVEPMPIEEPSAIAVLLAASPEQPVPPVFEPPPPPATPPPPVVASKALLTKPVALLSEIQSGRTLRSREPAGPTPRVGRDDLLRQLQSVRCCER
ncbi:hypothetical protein ACHHYP_09844 [Achlya hypogyna]|uniref:Wiskott-Aldrich syndrome protein family member n=1 Tax=Achlya hypogyna TaxID=1202772 RepID=A0A1V9ZIN9_ACHHY|nr:hypothetical protein ACHHYP_09844 [Achlya hypogyna]